MSDPRDVTAADYLRASMRCWHPYVAPLRDVGSDTPTRRIERPQSPDASRSDGAGVAAPPPAGRDTAAEPPSEVAE